MSIAEPTGICFFFANYLEFSLSTILRIRSIYRDIRMVDSNMEKGEQPVYMATLPQNIDEVVKMLA